MIEEEDREEQINLREYWRVLVKRRWVVFTIFSLVFLIVAINTFTSAPIYRASSRIVIEKENPNILSIQEVMAVDATGSDYYQTQYKIVESRSLARQVIDKLDLKNSTEFFPPPKNDILSIGKKWIINSIGFWTEQIASLIRTGNSSEDNNSQNSPGVDEDTELVNRFIGRISVEPVRNSRLVDVSMDAKDPALAARMTNDLVRTYIEHNLETKLRAAKDAVKWLSDRIEDERKKVEDAENALLRYKETHGIITGFSNDAEKITAEKLAQLSEQVVQAESKSVEAETRYRQAMELEKSPDMLDSIPEVLQNPLVREIKKMEVDLYNQMSELSKKYGRKHPKMVAIQSELAELQKRKIQEVTRVVNSLRNEYRLAIAREESLKRALAKQKAESLELNKKAIQYGVLRRQVESSRHMYELLIKRLKETTLTEEMKTGNIRIIDKAEIPLKPIKPKKKMNLLLAIMVGIVLGVGFAFLLEYLDNTIKLPEQIKSQLNIPYLGPVPAFAIQKEYNGIPPDLVTLHSPKSGTSESFRGIRTSILLSSMDSVPQVILVSSAGPEEGKTICAANIAVTMAQDTPAGSDESSGLEDDSSRVVLLDCDMRRPRLHQIFEIRRGSGISNILAGNEEFENAIVHTPVPNLDIISCGPIPPNPSELLGSRRMKNLIATLRREYTRIVIDTPPVTAVTDTMVLAPLADGVVFVVRAGDTPRPVIQNGLDQLKSVNAKVLGAVLNGVAIGKDGYYDYQYYYYYYGDDEGKDG